MGVAATCVKIRRGRELHRLRAVVHCRRDGAAVLGQEGPDMAEGNLGEWGVGKEEEAGRRGQKKRATT
jgi:hypothetical protein